jgi:hypothetical protein
MKTIIVISLLLCNVVFGYMDTDTLLSQVKKQHHPNISFRYKDDILLVDWKVKGSKEHVLLSFNEHAREIVTGELGLRTVQRLKEWSPKVSVTIIPVLNVWGRKKVEDGADCLRKNFRGVDTNRNFQMKFHRYFHYSEEYQGPFPLSEKESKLIAKELKHATRYVNIHSGEYSLYMPYDASFQKPPGADIMYEKLLKWSEHCPECSVGSAATTSSYKAYGTSVDWAIKHGVKESYTFEIYGDEGSRDCRKMFNPPADKLEAVLEPWLEILKDVLT